MRAQNWHLLCARTRPRYNLEVLCPYLWWNHRQIQAPACDFVCTCSASALLSRPTTEVELPAQCTGPFKLPPVTSARTTLPVSCSVLICSTCCITHAVRCGPVRCFSEEKIDVRLVASMWLPVSSSKIVKLLPAVNVAWDAHCSFERTQLSIPRSKPSR
jgi:hypothetical protein